MTLRACLLLFLFLPLRVGASNQTASQSLSPMQIIQIDTSASAPVVLANDTLFHLRAGMKGMTVYKRAEAVSRRILEVLAESSVSLDSITIDSTETSADIIGQNRLVLSIYDVDGYFAGTTRTDLAQRHKASIRAAVDRYREARSESTLIWGLILSAVATILLVIILRFLSRISRWIETRLGARLHGISVQQYELIRAEWLRTGLRVCFKFARVTVIVVLVYSYLEYVLSRFVWTRPLADHLLDLTLGPLRTIGLSFWNYLPNLFFLLVLFALARYFIRFVRFIFREIEIGKLTLPGFYPEWGTPTFNLVRILVVAIVLVVAFPYIPGSDSPAFKGLSLFLGVLFSFGSTSAIANVIAGVILTYMRSFRVGDIVKIQDTVGIVVSHGLLVTRVRTPKNLEVTIPNTTVLGTHIINYSNQARDGKLILPTSVTIGYDTPWRQVHALLLMAADKTAGILRNPAPFVLQTVLNDFYVTYELNVHSDAPERMPWIYSDLHQNIQDAFNEYGVQIMSPNYMMDRSKPTVVPKDQWYVPPARNPDASKSSNLDTGISPDVNGSQNDCPDDNGAGYPRQVRPASGSKLKSGGAGKKK